MTMVPLEASAVAWQQLEDAWEETHELWDDPSTDYFERQFWQPLTQDVESLQAAMEDLQEALTAAWQVIQYG